VLIISRWLRPQLRIAISANYILDDLIFLMVYILLLKKGAKKVFGTINDLYIFEFAIIIAFVIIASILISRRPYMKNTLFYVSFPIRPKLR
jgi:hypothetical protein